MCLCCGCKQWCGRSVFNSPIAPGSLAVPEFSFRLASAWPSESCHGPADFKAGGPPGHSAGASLGTFSDALGCKLHGVWHPCLEGTGMLRVWSCQLLAVVHFNFCNGPGSCRDGPERDKSHDLEREVGAQVKGRAHLVPIQFLPLFLLFGKADMLPAVLDALQYLIVYQAGNAINHIIHKEKVLNQRVSWPWWEHGRKKRSKKGWRDEGGEVWVSGRWFSGRGEYETSRTLILHAGRLFKGRWYVAAACHWCFPSLFPHLSPLLSQQLQEMTRR